MGSRDFGVPLLCGSWASDYVICGGGGGDGKTGVHNDLYVTQYDSESRELAEPLETFSTEQDTALGLAMHPNRQEFICSFAPCTRHKGKLDYFKLVNGQIERGRELNQLQELGEQRALVFSANGTLLATGGEDGHLRIFKWPSLEVFLDRSDAHRSVKDLDFSLDGGFLAATDDLGPSRVWDLKQLAPAAALPLNRAGFCRFSRDGARPCLYVTSVKDGKGYVTVWNMTWKQINSKKVQDLPISAFNISPDGKLLAVGSGFGSISIINASKLNVLQRINEAHGFFVSALDFSGDNRFLLSVSGDRSARVTALEAPHRGWRSILILWIILIAVIFSLVFRRGLMDSFQSIEGSHDMI